MLLDSRIRKCTPKDAAAIAEIYNESIIAGGSTMDDELKSEKYYTNLINGFGTREIILILETDQQIAGWGIIKRYSDRSGYRFCCETAVYLRHTLTGRGFGSKIKRALIDQCREFGYHHLVAKIFAENIASIEYNKKLGYEVVGIQKEIGYKNNQWKDIVIMQLVLNDVPPDIPEKYL